MKSRLHKLSLREKRAQKYSFSSRPQEIFVQVLVCGGVVALDSLCDACCEAAFLRLDEDPGRDGGSLCKL